MKKKIGIVTFWESNSNYGQILQNAALQFYLRSLGYFPETISFKIHSSDIKLSIKQRLERIIRDDVSIWRHAKRRLKKFFNLRSRSIHIKYSNEEYLLNRHFDHFKERYICYTHKLITTVTELKDLNKDSYIAFITGSDQVWTNAENDYSRQYAVLLSFVNNGIPRISYAASFGRNKIIDATEKKIYEQELPKFSAVSCREDSGVILCRQLGREDAKLVLDPTLLLSSTDWINFLGLPIKHKTDQKRLFIYSLQNNDNRIIELYEYFKLKGYEIDYACSASCKESLSNCELTIEEWVQKIREADIVLTNSFHGTIFSVNFHVPVISLAKLDVSIDSAGNRRMYSFLNEINMQDYLIREIRWKKIDELITYNVDWNKVDDYINRMRAISKAFLIDAIEG